MSGAASALLLPPSLSPGAAAAAAAAVASASVAGSPDHALHAADAIARGYLQGRSADELPLPSIRLSLHSISLHRHRPIGLTLDDLYI